MSTKQIGLWQVDVDASGTRLAYVHLAQEGRASCVCAPCRNFRALGGQVFPDAAHDLLRSLGVDARIPAEVYVAGPAQEDRVPYGGWFHFIGSLVGERGERLVDLGSSFTYFLHERVALVPPVFRKHPVVQFEFYVSAPWTLSEPYGESGHDVV